jgi:hypothetical protein
MNLEHSDTPTSKDFRKINATNGTNAIRGGHGQVPQSPTSGCPHLTRFDAKSFDVHVFSIGSRTVRDCVEEL